MADEEETPAEPRAPTVDDSVARVAAIAAADYSALEARVAYHQFGSDVSHFLQVDDFTLPTVLNEDAPPSPPVHIPRLEGTMTLYEVSVMRHQFITLSGIAGMDDNRVDVDLRRVTDISMVDATSVRQLMEHISRVFAVSVADIANEVAQQLSKSVRFGIATSQEITPLRNILVGMAGAQHMEELMSVLHLEQAPMAEIPDFKKVLRNSRRDPEDGKSVYRRPAPGVPKNPFHSDSKRHSIRDMKGKRR